MVLPGVVLPAGYAWLVSIPSPDKRIESGLCLPCIVSLAFQLIALHLVLPALFDLLNLHRFGTF
jgi:hypothetical protein